VFSNERRLISTHLLDGELVHGLLCWEMSVFMRLNVGLNNHTDFDGLILHLFALWYKVRFAFQPGVCMHTMSADLIWAVTYISTCSGPYTEHNIAGPPSCLCVSDFSLAIVSICEDEDVCGRKLMLICSYCLQLGVRACGLVFVAYGETSEGGSAGAAERSLALAHN
jgi:hypothetical protein